MNQGGTPHRFRFVALGLAFVQRKPNIKVLHWRIVSNSKSSDACSTICGYFYLNCILSYGSGAAGQCSAVGLCFHIIGDIVGTCGLGSDNVVDVVPFRHDARKHYSPYVLCVSGACSGQFFGVDGGHGVLYLLSRWCCRRTSHVRWCVSPSILGYLYDLTTCFRFKFAGTITQQNAPIQRNAGVFFFGTNGFILALGCGVARN